MITELNKIKFTVYWRRDDQWIVVREMAARTRSWREDE